MKWSLLLFLTHALVVVVAWPSVGYTAGDAAAQNKRCIDVAAAHQIVAGSRNAQLYPDQALSQMKGDRSFKFSEAELKAIVNNVYFGGASQIAAPMAMYKAVYEACVSGGTDARWQPLK